jgi:uncharacterized protein with FMN-binding domain
MRRIIMALLASAIGTALLVGLKVPGAPFSPAAVAGAPLDPAAPGDGNGPAASAGAPGASGVPAGGPGTVSAPPGTTPGVPAPGSTASGAPKPTSGPTATKTTAAPPASRTITGTAYAAKDFGSMQVRIVVTGTHIDSISTIKVSNRPGSTVSTLTPLALSAQAVPTKNVSGATYSSNAWKQSLQSAISQI